MDGLVAPAALPVSAIGLTGGIGSGKSTVAACLVACGAHLVDTDAIARAVTGPGGAAMPAVAATFGPGVVTADGALDRDRMRELAFGDPALRQLLEGILHPVIGQEATRLAALARGRPVVFDVPLLTESRHWRQRVQRVLVVDCETATQIERVAQRPGWTAESAARVVALQASRQARRAIADAVICNDGITREQLDNEVRQLWHLWCGAPSA